MKVSDLLQEEAPRLADAMKELNHEFRELAKRYQLTLVAPTMGWPALTKDGAWFGGGLGSMKGISDEEALLSAEKRRLGFIRALSKKLEAMLADGRKVMIGNGVSRSEKVIAEPGQVEKLLLDGMMDIRPTYGKPQMPSVIWFVGAPAGLSTAPLWEVLITAHEPGGDSHKVHSWFTSPADPAELKKLSGIDMRLKEANHASELSRMKGDEPSNKKMVLELMAAAKAAGVSVGTNRWASAIIYPTYSAFFSKRKVAPKGETVSGSVEIFLPALKKHGLIK